jgi:hypothetical protein
VNSDRLRWDAERPASGVTLLEPEGHRLLLLDVTEDNLSLLQNQW